MGEALGFCLGFVLLPTPMWPWLDYHYLHRTSFWSATSLERPSAYMLPNHTSKRLHLTNNSVVFSPLFTTVSTTVQGTHGYLAGGGGAVAGRAAEKLADER